MGDQNFAQSQSKGIQRGSNPVPVHAFRVFVAAPSGMEDEREAINSALSSFFINKSIYHGILFFPVHWYQLSPSGIGNPQSRINRVIEQCDFMIVLFKDRWGTPPDTDQRYSSGTEREYQLALEFIDAYDKPMQDFAILFGPIDQKSATKAQVQKIQSFRRKIEEQNQVADFTGIDDLKAKVDRIVSEWLYSPGILKLHTLPLSQGRPSKVINEDPSIRDSIARAVKRLDSGETNPAITTLAELSATGSWEARYTLGRSLKEQGRIDEALELLQELVDELSSQNDEGPDSLYLVKTELGSIYCTKGGPSLLVAEQLHKDCLRYYKKNKQLRRIAVELRNLGAVFRRQHSQDKAIQYIQDSIRLYEVLHAPIDLGIAYLELGQSYIECGFINEADDALNFAERQFDSLNSPNHKHELLAAKRALDTLRAKFARINQALDLH